MSTKVLIGVPAAVSGAYRTAAGTAAAEQLTTSAVASRIRQSANQHLKPSK